MQKSVAIMCTKAIAGFSYYFPMSTPGAHNGMFSMKLI